MKKLKGFEWFCKPLWTNSWIQFTQGALLARLKWTNKTETRSSLPVAYYHLTKSSLLLCFTFPSVALISLFFVTWVVQKQLLPKLQAREKRFETCFFSATDGLNLSTVVAFSSFHNFLYNSKPILQGGETDQL